jgi:hypothetical protein
MPSSAHRRSPAKSSRRARPTLQPLPGSTPRQVPAATLLATLRARGVRLSVSGDQLEVDAPRGTLTDLDQARLWRDLERVCALLVAEAQARSA